MFSKILCSLLFAFCSLPSYGQGEMVQGPFKIDGEKAIYFQRESNPDFPLGLYYDSGTKKFKLINMKWIATLQMLTLYFL